MTVTPYSCGYYYKRNAKNRSKGTALLLFLGVVLVINLCGLAQATAKTSSAEAEPAKKYAYDFGVTTGPLLPKGVPNAREILPLWGPHIGFLTRMGNVELATLNARSEGVTYYIYSLDLRLDLPNDFIPVHMTLGGHVDYYQGANQTSFRTVTGWHYGGGAMQLLAGNIWGRFDFNYRFSPGQSVFVGLSLVYRIPDGGADAN